MSSPVVVRRSVLAGGGAAAWVCLRTGREHNRMTAATIDELTRVMTSVSDDPALELVVLASGTADFSAGADPGILDGQDLAHAQQYVRAEYELFDLVERVPAVTVAAIDGYCLGNAAELSLTCDFRVAGPHLRWGYPEARLGLMAPVARLMRQVPRSIATRVALGGRWLDTAEAATHGVVEATVDDVSSEASVLAAVTDLTRATAAGARWTKQAIADARAGRHREPELAFASLVEAAHRDAPECPDEEPSRDDA